MELDYLKMIAQVIVSKSVLVSKIIGKAIYVFSVLGAVQDCYLLHSVVICVSVTLDCADSSVVGDSVH